MTDKSLKSKDKIYIKVFSN